MVQADVIRFGVFELDRRAGELRRKGVRIKLQDQPFRLLLFLLDHPGEIVTREELRERLWAPGTYVDFEHSLGTAVNKIRGALADSAENPRFLETVPRRGYRFIAPVIPATAPEGIEAPRPAASRRRHISLSIGALSLIVAALITALGSRSGASGIRSLAVLPLENLSHDPEQEYFAAGMTDELITDLANTSGLRVISRTSVTQYRGAKRSLPAIARELGVDAIVEGTVMRSKDRIRITAQLIQAAGDKHLWAHSYDRNLGDVLELQNDVARAIASEVRVNAGPRNARQAATHAPSPRAHDLYMQGRYSWNLRSKEGEEKGLEYFRQAAAEDPKYPQAYAGMADSFIVLGAHYRLPADEAFPKARAAAEKALSLDDSLVEAHTSLGWIKDFVDWDWTEGEKEFRRAIELQRNYPTAHHWYSHHLAAVGRPDEAVTEVKKAAEIDPFERNVNMWLADTLYYARRYDECIAQCRKTMRLFPDSAAEEFSLVGNVYGLRGDKPAAVANWKRAAEIRRDGARTAPDEAFVSGGYRSYLLKQIELLKAGGSGEATVPIAAAYARAGDTDEALAYLQEACRRHDPWLYPADPVYDGLRPDSRFLVILRQMRLAR